MLPFDPLVSGNATKLANFKSKYGVGPAVKLVGGYTGNLSDTGEKIQLLRPGSPTSSPQFYPALLEDEITYGIASPWPIGANGAGSSLQRLALDDWGNDASSWTAALPTVGAAQVSPIAGRWLFYNNSRYDAHTGYISGDPAINTYDDNAIATDKQALLPGGTANLTNYTSFSRGINGIMVDIIDLANEHRMNN